MSVQPSDDEVWSTLTPMQQAVAQRHVLAALRRSPAPPSGIEHWLPPLQAPARTKRSDRRSTLLFPVVGVCVTLVLIIGLFAMRPRVSDSADARPAGLASAAAVRPAPVISSARVSADSDVRSDGGLDYLGIKAEAEEQLKARLIDDHGVRYRRVHTRLSTLDGGGVVAFCGEVNSRTPLGGYGGFQRFLASRSIAATEATMSGDDFAQSWDRFCIQGVEGPKVWF